MLKSLLENFMKFARDNNVFFEFYPDFCNVKHQDSKVILLQGRIKDGIYVFPPLQSTNSRTMLPTMNSTVKSSNTFALWHANMGHASHNTIKQILPIILSK